MKKGFLVAAFLAGAGMLMANALSCNRGRPCLKPTLGVDLTREPFGATDLNAISGNQGLSAGFNRAGTITVLKWPNPSYYDQVKYFTTGRGQERLGAREDEGIFSGIYYRTETAEGFFWLRDLEHEQSYLGPRSVAVRTVYRSRDPELEIEQMDFVEPESDLLWRNYLVRAPQGAKFVQAYLLVYAHFSPQVSKLETLPLNDWCFDDLAKSHLHWSRAHDAFVQERSGRDASTKQPGSVALAFGFDRKSAAHFAGQARGCASSGALPDLFSPEGKGLLENSDSAQGQPIAALQLELDLKNQFKAEAGFLIAAARDEAQSLELIESGRNRGFARALEATEAHWRRLLEKVPLPAAHDARIEEVSLRSVISLVLGFCRDSGAIVASISTQPPYGPDWLRDGSYINEALLAAGFSGLVRRHNLFYVKYQSRPDHPVKHVPAGNWATNYFADGVPAMPLIWWEIDETAYGIWTLYRYFEETGDREYLEQVYPAIKRAADFLAEFRDPKTGLPEPSFETDIPIKAQTLRGAICAYFGLKFAREAGAAMKDEESCQRWRARKNELEQAILKNFYDPGCRQFVLAEKDKGRCEAGGAGLEDATLLWPAQLVDYGDPRADEAARSLRAWIESGISGKRNRGSYEPYGLWSLAKYAQGRPREMKAVQEALTWEANYPITRTGHLGEIWVREQGKVYPGEGQPQLTHHALFYLSALEAFGRQ